MQTLYTIKEALRINGYRRYQLLGEVEKLIYYMEKNKTGSLSNIICKGQLQRS